MSTIPPIVKKGGVRKVPTRSMLDWTCSNVGVGSTMLRVRAMSMITIPRNTMKLPRSVSFFIFPLALALWQGLLLP